DQRPEADALDLRTGGQVQEREQCGHQVDGPHLVIDYFATRNSRTGKNKGDAQGGVVQKDSMCRLAVLAQTFAMVAQSGHQRTRREPHLFQPAEEPAYVLIHVSNFTGEGVASETIL